MSQHMNPSSDSTSNKIYNFGRPFLVQYCLILHLSDPCPSVDNERKT